MLIVILHINRSVSLGLQSYALDVASKNDPRTADSHADFQT